MKIVVAPDSFKESLSAAAAARAIADGLSDVVPDAELVLVPLADGGEGTLAALVAATAAETVTARVTGPLGEPVSARFGLFDDGRSAIVEMAQASGLALVPRARRDALRATSFGTGELIRAALEYRVERVILGLGGSATTDGGAGMAQALGARLLDAEGREIPPPAGGGVLREVAGLDLDGLDPRLARVRFEVACDVDSPLTGRHGAAATFGPQKGASGADIAALDNGLARFFRIVAGVTGRAVAEVPRAGAAGGMGAAALALLDGRLRPGVDVVIEACALAERLTDAALVVTGEGRIDGQTRLGKVPAGVARLARARGIPAIGIGGSLADEVLEADGNPMDALVACVHRPQSEAEALATARDNLVRAGRQVGWWLTLAARIRP